MKISELSDSQKSHLAWRLDHKTACGMLNACKIAKMEYYGDIELVEVFEKVGQSTHSAKIHAKKVINFGL